VAQGKREADIVGRVKRCGAAIVPDLAAEKVDEARARAGGASSRTSIWPQQLACYPPDYVASHATPERYARDG